MPFGVVSEVGLGIVVLDFGGDRPRGRGSLRGEFAASHYNQWGHCCVYCGKMADWIRMPFGVVSGIGLGMDVLDFGGDSSK